MDTPKKKAIQNQTELRERVEDFLDECSKRQKREAERSAQLDALKAEYAYILSFMDRHDLSECDLEDGRTLTRTIGQNDVFTADKTDTQITKLIQSLTLFEKSWKKYLKPKYELSRTECKNMTDTEKEAVGITFCKRNTLCASVKKFGTPIRIYGGEK